MVLVLSGTFIWFFLKNWWQDGKQSQSEDIYVFMVMLILGYAAANMYY